MIIAARSPPPGRHASDAVVERHGVAAGAVAAVFPMAGGRVAAAADLDRAALADAGAAAAAAGVLRLRLRARSDGRLLLARRLVAFGGLVRLPGRRLILAPDAV